MKMTHKHDVYFSPHSTEAHSLVMQIADYCNKRGIWYKISESTLGIGIVYGGNVGYVIDADRKTEPSSSEIPNSSTISKMEQVETMSCQECKHFHENAVMYLDQCDFCFKDCKYEPKDEPQLTPNYCGTCKHREVSCGDLPCDVCHGYSNYEPKDEPQMDTEIAKAIVHKMIDDAVIAEDAYPDLRQKMHDAVDEYEPQTEDEILREQCRAFMGIVEQTGRSE